MHQQDPPAALREFFDSSTVALSLASNEDDNPLILANRRFTDLTGYAIEEIKGRNCRFLQAGDRARNVQAREKIHEFLFSDRQANVRTQILNYTRAGTPFVNLLYMSRLRSLDGRTAFLFASQFDLSRSRPELLAGYDGDLGTVLTDIVRPLSDGGLVIDGTLAAIANTAAAIAQAKMTLAGLDDLEGQ